MSDLLLQTADSQKFKVIATLDARGFRPSDETKPKLTTTGPRLLSDCKIGDIVWDLTDETPNFNAIFQGNVEVIAWMRLPFADMITPLVKWLWKLDRRLYRDKTLVIVENDYYNATLVASYDDVALVYRIRVNYHEIEEEEYDDD